MFQMTHIRGLASLFGDLSWGLQEDPLRWKKLYESMILAPSCHALAQFSLNQTHEQSLVKGSLPDNL